MTIAVLAFLGFLVAGCCVIEGWVLFAVLRLARECRCRKGAWDPWCPKHGIESWRP